MHEDCSTCIGAVLQEFIRRTLQELPDLRRLRLEDGAARDDLLPDAPARRRLAEEARVDTAMHGIVAQRAYDVALEGAEATCDELAQFNVEAARQAIVLELLEYTRRRLHKCTAAEYTPSSNRRSSADRGSSAKIIAGRRRGEQTC